MQPLSEKSLVLRAQSGDRWAFDELLKSAQVPLHRYLTQMLADRTSAEDVLQDTFMMVVRKISYLNDPSLFRAWMYRIATRLAFRALKRSPHNVSSEEIPESGIVDVHVDPWERERLLASLDRLSPASRAVIHLHYFDELAISEVAAILDLSDGTIKSRLAYGLKQLRKEMA